MDIVSALNYGTYQLKSAQLISLPGVGNPGSPYAPVNNQTVQPVGLLGGPNRRKLNFRYHPYGRNAPANVVPPPAIPLPVPPPIPLPPPLAPPISSIGIMDIGIGNCNLLFDQNIEPVTYFDTGYPLFFYYSTIPNTMRFGNPAYIGPIPQNIAGNLNVVLSHWDWDHWRLGHVAGLQGLNWLVPNQNLGPSATNFYNSIPVLNRQVYGGAPVSVFPNYTLYQCTVAPGSPPAVIQNNTGIAMSVQTNLPTADLAWHAVLLTADANCNTVGIAAGALALTGILAVHHGSNNAGAAMGLPAPAAGYLATGRIAYSYGINPATGYHPYGFPVPAAILAWQAQGWTVQRSTAEGPFLNNVPPALGNRGNIRVANNTALNAAYNGFAFFNFPNTLN